MLHKSAAAPLTAARSVSNKYLDSKFKHLSVFSKVYIPGVQYYGGWQNDGRAGGERLARLARSARHQDSDLQGVPRSPEMATVKTPETR